MSPHPAQRAAIATAHGGTLGAAIYATHRTAHGATQRRANEPADGATHEKPHWTALVPAHGDADAATRGASLWTAFAATNWEAD